MAQTKLGILIETAYKGKGVKAAEKDLKGLNKAAESSTSRMDKMKGSLGKVALGAGAMGAALFAAKKAFDFAAEGAQIQKIATTFDTLTGSVGELSNVVMRDLRTATAGMVADTDLMMSANRLMSMGLAETGKEAAELSKIAVTLGSAMGKNATQAMEEFALMMANQSIPRLDTFGISAGKVKTNIKELQAANKDMTREAAFMAAVMEEAAVSMERLGGEVPTDGMTELTVQTANLVDELKVLAATIVGPVASAFATTLRDARSLQERWNDLKDVMTDAQLEAARAAMTYKDEAEVITELEEAFDGLAIAQKEAVDTDFLMFQRAIVWALGEEIDAAIDADKALMRYGQVTEKATYANQEFTRAEIEGLQASRNREGILHREANTIDDVGSALKRTRDELKRGKAAWEDQTAAIAKIGAIAFDKSLAGGLSLINEELDELGPQLIITGGLTADQSDVLDEATRNYDRAVDAIGNYATGLRGYGMNADEVADSVKDLTEEQAYWLGIMSQYSEVQGEASLVTKTATADQEALNTALYESISAEETSIETKIALGLALGILNEAQVDAIMLEWELTEGVAAVKQAMLDGILSTDDARNALLTLGSEGGEALQTVIDQAKAAKESLDRIPRNITINIRTKKTTEYYDVPLHEQPGDESTRAAPPPDPLGTRAGGGPVAGRTPYIVGERGPELFVPPPGGGQIIPNDKIGSGGGVNLTLQFFGPVSESMAQYAADEVVSVVNNQLSLRG